MDTHKQLTTDSLGVDDTTVMAIREHIPLHTETALFFILPLYLMAFLRPIFIIQIPFELWGLSILDLFSIVMSLLLLLATAISIRNIKVRFTSILIIFFSLYCILSIAWGSQVRDVTKIILPFLAFFAAQSLVKSTRQMKSVLTLLVLGYAVFITANVIEIAMLKGGSVNYVYQIDLARYGGLTGGSHSLAHAMFIFSVVYALHVTQSSTLSRSAKVYSSILLALSVFCIYKTYTRTVYIGLFLFWLVYFLGTNRRILFVYIFTAFMGLMMYQAHLSTIFWDVKDAVMTQKFEKAGSGRISIWSDTLDFFSHMSMEKRLLGTGLGYHEESHFKRKNFSIGATHNDYLGLLVTTGLFGFILYLGIMSALFFSILLSPVERGLKTIMLAFTVSVIAMNMLSNSYITRVELAQLFWLIAGLFHARRDSLEKQRTLVPAALS